MLADNYYTIQLPTILCTYKKNIFGTWYLDSKEKDSTYKQSESRLAKIVKILYLGHKTLNLGERTLLRSTGSNIIEKNYKKNHFEHEILTLRKRTQSKKT